MNATSLADLWVQAAINVDNEEVFETDSESELSVFEEGHPIPSTSLRTTSPARPQHHAPSPARHQHHAPSPARHQHHAASPVRQQHRPSMASNASRPYRGLRRLSSVAEPTGARRPSAGSFVPAIFSHTGVRTPPTIAQVPTPGNEVADPLDTSHLSTIAESRPVSGIVEEKAPPLWSTLPLMIIFQYGILALHTTTHDQVFYLYLVSKYSTGGLELTPSNFAQLSTWHATPSALSDFSP